MEDKMKSIFLTLVALLVMVSASHAQPAFEHRSLEEALNPDGTLKRGVQGSFKVDGYQMRTGANGEPIFLPQTQNTVSGTWDTQFGLPDGVSGYVYAIAIDGQGNVYVGGEFGVVGGLVTPVSNIVLYNPSTNTWSSLGTGTNNGVSGGGPTSVNALAVLGNDLYVGGNFTQAGGVSANYVARYNPTTNNWSALGSGSSNGVSGIVSALVVLGNDLYVGGSFGQAGGMSANNVARFNPAANTWSVLGTGSSNGVNNQVSAMAVDGQGNLYVGGGFSSAGGVSANRVARYNPTTNSWSALGTGAGGVNGNVSALAVLGSDLYVGGNFTQAGGVNANSVARYNPTMNSWSALGTGAGGVDGDISALAVVGNDLYVVGNFSRANAGGTSGSVVNVNRIARFNATTNAWGALTGTGGGNGVNSNIFAIATAGSDLYVGGSFTEVNFGGTVNAQLGANCIARFNTTTNTWSTLGSGGIGVNESLPYPSDVSSFALAGSNLYVGGTFKRVGGVRAENIARFNTTTNTWSAIGVINDPVAELLLVDNNLYVVGSFTRISGLTANRVARFNITNNTWSALGTGNGNGVNTTASSLAMVGSDLYIGGGFSFANVGGTEVNARSIVRFNTTTNTWSALGTGSGNGVNGRVNALAVVGNDLYVGGNFTQANVGGTVVNANYIARFNTTTNTWSALGTGSGNGVNGEVRALAVVGNDLYVGGSFTQANVGGTVVNANYIARFNTTTNTWSALGTGSSNGVNLTVTSMSVDGQNNVYVGGEFTAAGGVSANRVARFNTTTNVWSALTGTGNGNGVGFKTAYVSRVTAITVVGSDLYLGGNFTQANVGGTSPIASACIARWTSGTSRVESIRADVPRTFLLEQNYPNPFNPTTVIGYQLPVASEVSLKVYDVLGREVMTLVNGKQEAGVYNFTLNATGLASGIYFYRLQAGNFVQTKKMMLVK